MKKLTKKGKIILTTGITIVTGGLTVLGIWWWRKRNSNSTLQPALLPPSMEPIPVTPGKTSALVPSGFPLRQGSKGALVGQLQEGLIKRYGSSILLKYGADKDWGAETTAALKGKGWPVVVDLAIFQQIVSGNSTTTNTPSQSASNPVSSSLDAYTVARNLRSAAMGQRLTSAITTLKKLNTVSDYKAVSDQFKKWRVRGVRQTLVNGMLSSFSSTHDKLQISNEFKRMGLKHDGLQWSLAGVSSQLMTIRSADVWGEDGATITVPSGTVLGQLIQFRDGVAMFRIPDGSFLNVSSNDIKHV